MSSQDNDRHNAHQHDAGHPDNQEAKIREGTETLQALADDVEAEREQSRENTNSLPESMDQEDPPHEDEENVEGSGTFPDEVQVLPAVRPHP